MTQVSAHSWRRSFLGLVLGMAAGFGLSSYSSLATTLNRLIQMSPGDSITLSSSDVMNPIDVRCGSVEDPTLCTQYVVARASLYGIDAVIRAERACQGNFASACVRAGAEQATIYSESTLETLAVACRKNPNDRCLSDVLDRSGASDSGSTISAAQACQGNLDEACVKMLAEQGNYYLFSDLVRVAKTCGSQSPNLGERSYGL